ncbi:MAG TPA: His-Xaa-Ser system radical SAM maturase HxsB [Armatimonadota bacterium]|nr:His-Xaa-Ser system radical SAM maturase HxsB [Armatimonadota bacterium]
MSYPGSEESVDVEKQSGPLRKIIFEHAFSPAQQQVKKNDNHEDRPFIILPFTFRRLCDGQVLLVNQAGEFLFLPADDFQSFVNGTLDLSSSTAADLESKQFVSLNNVETPIDLLATKLRTRKGYLRDFTALHMIVLTCCCNCRCTYCQASSLPEHATNINMSRETARRVVDMVFQSPSNNIKIEFQGGEPTLNWDVLTYIVQYAETVNAREKRVLEFVICTNLTRITEEMLHFLQAHHIHISSSLDGPKNLHDRHRILRDGSSSYDAFIKNLGLVRRIIGMNACAPLLTITRDNLHHLKDVVDEYRRLEFHGIFLRPVNPYGYATDAWKNLCYSMDEFVHEYKSILQYIIQLNIDGTPFVEYYTTLLLTRILTPFSTGFMDLQSPAGAGISGVIYDYDGSVYPTDEGRMLARMNNKRFLLGNVQTNSYEEIFLGESLRDLISHSCVETMPGCAACAYQLYCGADPVRNYVECGDITGHRPTSNFCKRNRAIFDHLFSLLRQDDPMTMDVFWSWITNRPLQEVAI